MLPDHQSLVTSNPGAGHRRVRPQHPAHPPRRVPWAALTFAALAAALASALASACARGPAELAPPYIVYGEDVCDECRMIITDERFAAAYQFAAGGGRYDYRIFDDIGDMLIHAANHPEHDVRAWYVHDYETLAWLEAPSAHFVFSADLRTPMAQGLAAHATLEAARAMADTWSGEVLNFRDVRGRYSFAAPMELGGQP